MGRKEIRNKGEGENLQQEHQVLHSYSFLKNSRFNGCTGKTIQPVLLNTFGVQTRKANQQQASQQSSRQKKARREKESLFKDGGDVFLFSLSACLKLVGLRRCTNFPNQFYITAQVQKQLPAALASSTVAMTMEPQFYKQIISTKSCEAHLERGQASPSLTNKNRLRQLERYNASLHSQTKIIRRRKNPDCFLMQDRVYSRVIKT